MAVATAAGGSSSCWSCCAAAAAAIAAATTTANLLMTSAKTQEPLYLNINKDFTFVIYDETNKVINGR